MEKIKSKVCSLLKANNTPIGEFLQLNTEAGSSDDPFLYRLGHGFGGGGHMKF
jgi:hypothetical protein